MVEACNLSHPSICQWSDDGKLFAIKDAKTFCEVIMPKFFNGRKFRSFVRQLEFYGFSKTKKDGAMVNSLTEDPGNKIWCFCHENFIRDKPELLVDMRRPRYEKSPCVKNDQLQKLKGEVNDLRENISRMTGDLKDLKSLMESILKGFSEFNKRKDDELNDANVKPYQKKRRFTPDPVIVTRSSSFNINDDHAMECDRKDISTPTSLVYENDEFDSALEELGPISHELGDLSNWEIYNSNKDTGVMKLDYCMTLPTKPIPGDLSVCILLDPEQLQKLKPSQYHGSSLRPLASIRRGSLPPKRTVASHAA